MFRENTYNRRGIDLETEKKNLYKIATLLISILDKYKRPYKDDMVLLNSGDIEKFSNKYNALVIVSSEKNIIQEYIVSMFKILDYIDLKPSERKLDTSYLIDYFNLLDQGGA